MTASAPIGLYRRSFGGIENGAWLLIRPPEHAAILAAARGYLPKDVPMVRRLAAQSGDRVCRDKHTITVNGTMRAKALLRDKQGRTLPSWQGCETLHDGQVFVLTAPPDSFDSRNFGAVPRANLIARIEPLWTF